MILDHPLRKSFTIEEAALVAAELAQYDSFKESIRGTYSFIDINSEAFKQSSQYEVIQKRKLANKFIAMFKQEYYDGNITPYVDLDSSHIDRMLFCRKSLSRILEKNDMHWFCFDLDENKAFSFPTEYVSLVHDNQFKLGFTPCEIALMFYDIGSVNTIKDIQPYEYHSLKSHELSKELQEIKANEAFKLNVNKEVLLLIKSALVIEAKRILQGFKSDLIIESAPKLPGLQSIDYDFLTFSRESIHKYLNNHNLMMQAKLFIPYENKLQELGGEILNRIKAQNKKHIKETTDKLALTVWSWALEQLNQNKKITLGICESHYNRERNKQNLNNKNSFSGGHLKTMISSLAKSNGYRFKNGPGLQKIDI